MFFEAITRTHRFSIKFSNRCQLLLKKVFGRLHSMLSDKYHSIYETFSDERNSDRYCLNSCLEIVDFQLHFEDIEHGFQQ